MQKTSFFILAILLFLTACDSTQETLAPFEIAKSTQKREKNPQTTPQALQHITAANNQLTFDLFQPLTATENHVQSSYSLFNLLSMLTAASNGKTQTQILQALHLQNESHQALNALNSQLTKTDDGFRIIPINALWLQKDFDIHASFLDTLALHYGAAVYLLDFQKNTNQAIQTINSWVADKTENIIQNLLPQNALNTQTKLVLTNALYLKGDWVHKFPQQRTLFKNFTKLDGTLTQVQTMHQENDFLYQEFNNTKVLSMRYHDSDYALLSIMPPKGDFETFKETFTPQTLSFMIKNLQRSKLNLYYPRFTFSSQKKLIKPLQDLGMHDAFTQDADFSRLSKQALFISQIVQQTTIIVDENGTQAAAATSISIGTTSIPNNPPLEVKFDHPFLFALYHKPTQTILFYGQMLNPSNQ